MNKKELFKIKADLKERGISLLELARFCNISNAMVSRFFAGHKSETIEKGLKKILNK